MSLTTIPTSSPIPLPSSLDNPSTQAPSKPKLAAVRKRRFAGKLILAVIALIMVGLAIFGIVRWLLPGKGVELELTATVTRGDLPIVVTERGDLESAKTITAKCEVEVEQTSLKIVSILPEGTRVKKGDVVVELDTDKLKSNLAEQEIKYNTADGKYQAAIQEYEVQKNKAETETAKAQLALTLAELDLVKYVKGEYLADLDEKKGAIKLAEKELQDAEEKLTHFQAFVKKGFGTPEQLRSKELEVEKARNYLARDKAKLVVLEQYMRKRQEAELTFKAKDAKRELERTEKSGKANIAKAEADMKSARVVAELEKTRLERFKKQLEFAVIKAPEDGILVYSQTRFWDPQSRIQVGALVMYQQAIFQLPELDHMQVKVRIHESKVKKIKEGQKAEIRVEALPNRVLHGTVKNVATLADMAMSWRRGGIKEYETVVTIDDLPSDAALKPNMTAEVSIKVDQVSDVLLVPVQAVAEIEGQHFVYVAGSGGIERREVTVGKSNEKYVEIQEDLEEGERACLDARKRAAEEAKTSGAKETPVKEAPARAPAAEPSS
jgi:RND family efflux transporter MFP subunit